MKRFKLLSLLTVFAIALAPVVALVTRPATAASLTDVTVYLNVETASGTNTDADIVFGTTTNVTADSILTITFDSGFVETPGGLVTGDVDVYCDADSDPTTNGTAMTAATVTDSTQDLLVIDTNTDTCNDFININITGGTNNIQNPGTIGNYNVSVASDIGGTGTTVDYGAGLAYVGQENDVEITAIVPPTIDMELYQPGSDTLLSNTGTGSVNVCPLGVLSLSSVNTCLYDVGTGTNNAAGLTVRLTSDGAFDDGLGNDINACAGTNCDSVGAAAVNAGQEEFGFYASENGGGEYTVAGAYGSAHQAVPTSATTIATTSTTGNGTTSGQAAQRLEITNAASMDISTVVGTYRIVKTWTAFTN